MTPLQRLQAAREKGREACKQGKPCLPAIDKNLEEVHEEARAQDGDASYVRDAWRFGWYEEYYSRHI
jgi:hypothetical protein